MKIGPRLAIGFLFVILGIWMIVYLSMNSHAKTHEELWLLNEDVVPSALAMAEMTEKVQHIRICTLLYIATGNVIRMNRPAREWLYEAVRSLEEVAREYAKHGTHIGLEEQKAGKDLEYDIEQLTSAAAEVVDLRDQGGELEQLLEKMDRSFHPAFSLLSKKLEEHKAVHMEKLVETEKAVHEAQTSSRRLLLIATGFVTVLAVAISFFITRSIVDPLRALHRGTQAIGLGNLDYKVGTHAKDEIGQFSRAFDRMTANLRESAVWIESLKRQIANRNQAEEALRESEQRFHDLSDAALEGIVIIDCDARILDANLTVAKMFSYEVSELTGMNGLELVAPEFRELAAENILFTHEEAFESMGVRKDGATFPAEICCKTTQYKGQEARVTAIRDISDRKQAHEALRKTAAIVDGMVDGVTIIDMQGRISSLNKAATAQLGYEEEEAIGKTPAELFVADKRRPKFHENLGAVLSGKPIKDTEHLVVRKDGTEFPASVNLSVLTDEDGKPREILLVHRDITERKRTEEEKRKLQAQLVQAQKLEAIGTLAGGVAHDFNNLLMAIQGNVSLMLLDIDSTHPHYKSLTSVQDEIRRGAKLTSQLLGYARKGRYFPQPINLNQLVEETSETFGRAKKEITIRRELAEDLFVIETDPGQMEQILLNIYINAADAMPDGGDLILKTKNATHEDMRRKVNDPKPGNYVLLKVTDTGSGMDSKSMERILDPFFTAKEIDMDTGIGLASTYGIIKGHGGYINVESELGRGTTFSIYLPATNNKVKETVRTAEQVIKGNETLLLVDDEAQVLDSGIKVLKRLGYTVVQAKDGKEAVEIYKGNKDKIDLVVLDMIMPRMGGGEAYNRMKEINPRVKVLLTSGYSIDSEAQEILARGCDAFIQKPLSMKELSHAIRNVLEKK